MYYTAAWKRWLSVLLAGMLALLWGAGVLTLDARAAESGAVYTCEIVPCYAHPVTGEIEDAGGESSYATGQGMVEGAVYTFGIMEVTQSGSYYLTIRMSLIDYCSGHTFWVQNVGDSSWSAPAELGVTATGSDSNGTTYDICMKVPSENCIVRGAMYVEPMGRDVIFYCYPTNYSSGNSTSMVSTMVTTSSGSSSGNSGNSSNSSGGSSSGSGTTTNGGSAALSGDTGSSTATDGASGDTTESGETTEPEETAQAEEQTDVEPEETEEAVEEVKEAEEIEAEEASAAEAEETEEITLDNNDIQQAVVNAGGDLSGSTLDSAEGLSLSTAGEEETEEEASDKAASSGVGMVIAIAGSVIAVLLVAALIVYFFRKNWAKWGGQDRDDDGV